MIKFVDYDIVFQEVPGEVTLAINLSGCPNGCCGCHTPELMGDIGEELTEGVLLELIARYRSAITCLCFMGGDGDVETVEALARVVRSKGLKSAWYSGRELFPSDDAFDYVKLGGYIENLGGLRSDTTNQRFYSRSDNGWVNETHHFLWNIRKGV